MLHMRGGIAATTKLLIGGIVRVCIDAFDNGTISKHTEELSFNACVIKKPSTWPKFSDSNKTFQMHIAILNPNMGQ